MPPLPRRAALLGSLLLPCPARAQTRSDDVGAAFPSRPVRLIIPYPPGGASDVTARLIGEWLSPRWGQPMPIENRPGADGIIGTELVSRAPADGHTLAIVSAAHAVNVGLYRLPFDPVRNFSLLTVTASVPLVLSAAPDFPASDPAGLVALARGGRGRVSFAGSPGVVRLAAELFAARAGVDLTYVPYRGSTQAHPDLLAGRVSIMFDSILATLPHLQSGRLKALATTGATRSPLLPDVPTMAEALLPGFEASSWGLLLGPAGLPPAVTDRIWIDVTEALQRAETRARLRDLGAEVVASSPEATERFVQAEITKWSDVARAAGIERQ